MLRLSAAFHKAFLLAMVFVCSLCAEAQDNPTRSMLEKSPGKVEIAAPAAGDSLKASAPVNSAFPAYTIGSGDLLNISVWKEKELSPVVTVRPDGVISMPLLGEVVVSGLTPLQVQEILTTRLRSIIVNPQVTVTVAEIHSRTVYITGEVARPGAYAMTGPLSVLQLIAQAGGPTLFASRKRMRIVSASGATAPVPFDYTKAIAGNQPTGSVALCPGDTVVVP